MQRSRIPPGFQMLPHMIDEFARWNDPFDARQSALLYFLLKVENFYSNGPGSREEESYVRQLNAVAKFAYSRLNENIVGEGY